ARGHDPQGPGAAAGDARAARPRARGGRRRSRVRRRGSLGGRGGRACRPGPCGGRERGRGGGRGRGGEGAAGEARCGGEEAAGGEGRSRQGPGERQAMIRIVTLSEFPPDVIDFVSRRIHAAYGMGCELEGEGEMPRGALDDEQSAYDAVKAVEEMD